MVESATSGNSVPIGTGRSSTGKSVLRDAVENEQEALLGRLGHHIHRSHSCSTVKSFGEVAGS